MDSEAAPDLPRGRPGRLDQRRRPGARLDPARGEPAPRGPGAGGRRAAAAARPGRGGAHRAGTRAPRPCRPGGPPAAPGRGGARRPHLAAARPGPAGGLSPAAATLVPVPSPACAPVTRSRRRAHRGGAARGARAARAGDVDLALVFGYDGDPAVGAGLVWRPLADEPVALVLAADHPLAAGARLALADLADEPWIVGCDRCRAHAVALCAAAGFERRSGTSATTTWWCRTSSRSGSASPCCRTRRWRRTGTRASSRREHASFGTRTYGIVHRPGAERVPRDQGVDCRAVVSGPWRSWRRQEADHHLKG